MDRAADLIGLALVAVIATLAVVILATTSKDGAVSSSTRSATSALPSCADAAGDAAAGAQVSCRTKRATIELVQGTKPLLLQDVQVRLLRAEQSNGGLNVRLRLRNTTDRSQSFRPGRRQVYLSVGGRRVAPVAAAARTIAAQKGVTATLRFPGVAARRAMDLGVVPFAKLGHARPSTIGVIHLPAQAAS
jgi:hypothetical protein